MPRPIVDDGCPCSKFNLARLEAGTSSTDGASDWLFNLKIFLVAPNVEVRAPRRDVGDRKAVLEGSSGTLGVRRGPHPWALCLTSARRGSAKSVGHRGRARSLHPMHAGDLAGRPISPTSRLNQSIRCMFAAGQGRLVARTKRGSIIMTAIPTSCWRVALASFALFALMCAAPLSAQESTAPPPPPALSAEQVAELVAPIALYPDALVAQVLAASTYPTEIVEADRWIQEHASIKGDALAQSIDKQSWDPSVKALTQFPAVLATMDKNLSWTSALGEAYVREPQGIMNAVQALRSRAQQAGNLKSAAQQTVTTDAGAIAIQPADPEVVYVPEYDPWVIYGAPLAFYPGWVGVSGVFFGGPGVYFGVGIGIGLFGGFAWGWHHWHPDWHHHEVMFDHHPFVSHSPSFFNHGSSFDDHGHAYRGHAYRAAAALDHSNRGRPSATAGHAFTPASPALHTGAFGGFDHGGVVGAYSARGRASLGADSHNGGFAGGFHGGGFTGGGFHR